MAEFSLYLFMKVSYYDSLKYKMPLISTLQLGFQKNNSHSHGMVWSLPLLLILNNNWSSILKLSHWTVVSRKIIEYFETQNAWFSEKDKSLHLTDDDGKASEQM